MSPRLLIRRLRRAAASEDGFGFVELLIAMTILAIAIGGLLAVFSASALSLRRAGQKGTALTLANAISNVRVTGGRGRMRNVASVTTPSRPSLPTNRRWRSKPVLFPSAT
jgi:type II secretory pathway pseudopilin PulG